MESSIMKKKYLKFEDTENIGGEQHINTDAQLPSGFAESVEVFSANDVDNVTVIPRKRRKASFSVAQAVVLVICAVTFAFSSVMLVKWKLTTDKADSFYDVLQNIFNSQSAVSLPNALYKSASAVCLSDMLSGKGNDIIFISPEKLTHFEEMLTKLERIRAIAARAKDVYGWVKVSDTASIDYPIMRTSNNEYYLTKLPDGTTSSSGSIFADYRTENYILNNRHVVLYGHNMADGSMFRDLRYFYWPSKVLSKYKNTKVEIITDDGIYIYKVFSMYTATSGNNYTRYSFSDDDDYVAFLQSIYNQNMFYGYDEALTMEKYINPDTKLLTLSTCTSNHLDPNERFVLHCVLVEKAEPEN